MDKRKDDDLERRLLELGTLEELEELVDRIHLKPSPHLQSLWSCLPFTEYLLRACRSSKP
jgi:hypothetical protein